MFLLINNLLKENHVSLIYLVETLHNLYEGYSSNFETPLIHLKSEFLIDALLDFFFN